MSAALRIALADDQALIRSGLAALLGDLGIAVAVLAVDGQDLLEALHHQRVDAVVCDIRMPRISGLDAVRALRRRGDFTPVLLLTTFDEPALLAAARSAGAQGFMLKDAAPQELITAISCIAAGGTLFSALSLDAARQCAGAETVTSSARLTERELSVLRLVAGGYSNKEIGRALNISDGTARNHLTEILAKLDARDRTHAVMKALAARLL